MAIEDSPEKIWNDWYNSGNPILKGMADRLFPTLSIKQELRGEIMKGELGFDRTLKIGKIIRKYAGPKDEFLNADEAYKALVEIRHCY